MSNPSGAPRYSVRPYRDGDAEAVSALCRAAIVGIGPHAYSVEQTSAWLARHPGPARYRERVAEGARIFVAVGADDAAAAYSLIEPDGHLDHLYAHPDHARRGLAALVLQAAEDHARAERVELLYTEASELARPAFERAGYRVLHRRDFTIAHEGRDVPIHNYAMEKRLR